MKFIRSVEKKTMALFAVGLSIILGSCGQSGMSIEGTMDKELYNGKSVYLYAMTSQSFNDPKLLTTTVVEGKSFKFEGLDADASIMSEVPCIVMVSFFDILDEQVLMDESNHLPVATLVLEKGDAKVKFTDTSVSLSGTKLNTEFNDIHATITDIVGLAELAHGAGGVDNIPANAAGKDGRAQFEEINGRLKTQTYNFAKGNMTNNAGQFIFLKSYVDDLFTPGQMTELIDMAPDKFKAREDVAELKSILDQMNAGLLNFSGDVDELDLMK